MAVLVPKVGLGETCPAACTGNPAETCFYDAVGCSGGVDTLGCGAGGYVNCRFCGFGPFGPCGQQQQPPQVMAEVTQEVDRLLQGYPAVSEGTRVQVDVTYTLELALDLLIAGGGGDDRTTDEEHAQRLLAAFRAVACGTPEGKPELAGGCLAQLDSMTSSLVNATGVGRRRVAEGDRLLQMQLQSQTATPLPPALVAVALNATTFNEAIAAWLRAHPYSSGAAAALLSVQRRATPDGTLSVDVRMLRFSDVAAERRDLEEVAKQIALALQDDFILNPGSQALAAAPITSGRLASELALLLISLLLLCGCLAAAFVRHRHLRRAKIKASIAGGEPVAGLLKAPKSSKQLLTPSQLRSSAASGEEALEDEGSSQLSAKGGDGLVDAPPSPMRTTGSAKLLAATLPVRSTKRLSVQPGTGAARSPRAQIQPEGQPEGQPEADAIGTQSATPQRRTSGLLGSLARGAKGHGRAKPIFTRFDDGATASEGSGYEGSEEATASQDGSAAAVAPAAPPPSKWARAGIEARRQSAVQRAQSAEIHTFGKAALKKGKNRIGLAMADSALVEGEEEEGARQGEAGPEPTSPQARVTRL